MKDGVIAAISPGEMRIAAVRGGRMADYAVWRPGRPDGVGEIHTGRIAAVMPALAGAFVALVNGTGFLPDSAGAAGLGEGDAVTVRIVRAAQGGKGPRLAALPQPGSLPPRRLHAGPTGIERVAAMHPDLECREVAGFDDAVEGEIEGLASPEVALPNGMRASIHPTPALVAIDIDTASASAARRDKKALQEALNTGVFPEIARQIRLRNLSGAILIDLAGMALRRRATLGPKLGAAIAWDPLQPRLVGFTGMGFAEIARPRVHPPLHELLAGPHAAGLAALRRVVADFDPARSPALRAAPAVVAALQADPVALPAVAHALGAPLKLRADPLLPGCGWSIEEHVHG